MPRTEFDSRLVTQQLEKLRQEIGGVIRSTKKFYIPYLALSDKHAAVFWLWNSKCWLVFRRDCDKQRVNTMGEVLKLLKDSTHAKKN